MRCCSSSSHHDSTFELSIMMLPVLFFLQVAHPLNSIKILQGPSYPEFSASIIYITSSSSFVVLSPHQHGHGIQMYNMCVCGMGGWQAEQVCGSSEFTVHPSPLLLRHAGARVQVLFVHMMRKTRPWPSIYQQATSILPRTELCVCHTCWLCALRVCIQIYAG